MSKDENKDLMARALLFDMDNTLFDLVGAKLEACRMIAEGEGIGTAEDLFSYFLRRTRGFEDPENIRDYLMDMGSCSPETYERCCRIYRDVKLASIEPYPGVRKTLEILRARQFGMALVTDAHHRDALPRLEKTGLLSAFDHVVTFDMTWMKKPSHVPFLYALQRLGAAPEMAVLIGDSPRRDIAPGNALGMRTVYARYGDRSPGKRGDGGATHVIDDIRDLLSLPGFPGSGAKEDKISCAADSR